MEENDTSLSEPRSKTFDAWLYCSDLGQIDQICEQLFFGCENSRRHMLYLGARKAVGTDL
jgi:hypothetical protein